MKRHLVIQLARFGDLLQSRRLLASLALPDPAQPHERIEVHLLTDHSLAGLARRLHPEVVIHSIQAHGLADPAQAPSVLFSPASRQTLRELAGLDFDSVACCNYSGLALAVSRLFPAERIRGYRDEAGQVLKDPLFSLAFRWIRNRRAAGLNLADLWAFLAPRQAAPDTVNPKARPKGGGLGLALAGRHARRALPPEILAPALAAVFAGGDYRRLAIFGTTDQAPLAKALLRRLKPGLLDRTEDLCGQTDLPGLMDQVAGLDLLLSPDTGLMHLAAALGTPTISFFLSSAWCHETGPYGAGHLIWQGVGPCAPCLEAAPCPDALSCRKVFADPAFLARLSGRAGRQLPEGLAAFDTGFDALGLVCNLVEGDDPTMAKRLAFRRFLEKHLGLDRDGQAPPTPETAATLYAETDWTLPGRPARPGPPDAVQGRRP